jgi:predicted PhzF superfamily epimerase YddE/YHI9
MAPLLYQVDAFTDEPFKGNPAAVCLLERQASVTWMKGVAREMNLSETAFVSPARGGWRLRWFTPKKEVDLCGHATLASAKVLFGRDPALRVKPILFKTRSGDLFARWADGDVELDFPAMPYRRFSYESHVDRALGFRPWDAVFSGDYYLFEAEDEAIIRKTIPNIPAIEKLPMPEVIITARSKDPAYDFISRFFAPQLGIAEDPVTGSAHCLLAPYWAEKLGKREFTAYQASPRGGTLHLHLDGQRVMIRGAAVIIFVGELQV